MGTVYSLADGLRDRLRDLHEVCRLDLTKTYEIRDGEKELRKYEITCWFRYEWVNEFYAWVLKSRLIREFRKTKSAVDSLVWTEIQGVRKGSANLCYGTVIQECGPGVKFNRRHFSLSLTISAESDIPWPKNAEARVRKQIESCTSETAPLLP